MANLSLCKTLLIGRPPAASYALGQSTNERPTDGRTPADSLRCCPSACPRFTSRSSSRSARGSTWAKRYRLCRTSRTRFRLEAAHHLLGEAISNKCEKHEQIIKTIATSVATAAAVAAAALRGPLEACSCSFYGSGFELASLRCASGRRWIRRGGSGGCGRTALTTMILSRGGKGGSQGRRPSRFSALDAHRLGY